MQTTDRRVGFTAVVSMAALISSSAGAQAPAPVPSATPTERFEVVAIKPGDSNGPRMGLEVRPGGSLELVNMPITLLVEQAYGVRSYQLVAGPAWMREQTFSVRARAEGDPTMARVNAMIRTLLSERFHFVAHTERRSLPTWIMTRARPDGRLGPNLRPRQPPCEPGSMVTNAEGQTVRCGRGPMGATSLEAIGVTMPLLADILSALWLNMPVADRTGLIGQYDVTLSNVESQWGPRGPSVTASTGDAVTVPVAVQEQLGLKLQLGEAPLDVLVVDRVEPPEYD